MRVVLELRGAHRAVIRVGHVVVSCRSVAHRIRASRLNAPVVGQILQAIVGDWIDHSVDVAGELDVDAQQPVALVPDEPSMVVFPVHGQTRVERTGAVGVVIRPDPDNPVTRLDHIAYEADLVQHLVHHGGIGHVAVLAVADAEQNQGRWRRRRRRRWR